MKALQPDLIGFSVVTAHYQWALSFARKVKAELPNIPIIFGGKHPTLVPEVVIREDCVDFVCVGEGEEALAELLESLKNGDSDFNIRNIWYKKNGETHSNPVRPLIENLDALPFSDKELFYRHLPSEYKRNTYFFSSRGCPFSCTYCCNDEFRTIYKGLGRYIRQMSVERTIEELIDIKQRHKPKLILFEDDLFTANRRWIQEFLPRYVEKIGLPFTCSGHAQFLSEEVVQQLKKSGCRMVWFGIQSASEEMRLKVLHRHEKNKDILRVAELCRKAGLRFMVDHILNLPFDTDEAIREAITLYNEMRPCVINVYPLLYFPKAEIVNLSIQYGQLKLEDVEMINQGKTRVYQGGGLRYKEKDQYRKYALLLTCIPLLPKSWVAKIEKSERLINFFGRLPPSLITPVKLIIYYRAGYGFLPLGILKIELFFTKQLLAKRIKEALGLRSKNKPRIEVGKEESQQYVIEKAK